MSYERCEMCHQPTIGIKTYSLYGSKDRHVTLCEPCKVKLQKTGVHLTQPTQEAKS